MEKIENYGLQSLSLEEQKQIDGGGFLLKYLAIGTLAAATLGIYEAGKAVGEFIYHLINE